MLVKPHEIYQIQMTEAKLRILAAERVSASNAPLTGLSSLDCEFCYLQIRKIVELITFAGMVREEARYRKFRETEKRKATMPAPDPAKDWNATEILSRLVKLSPHMLPIPLGAQSQPVPGVINFNRARVAVNHARLIELYKVCSGFMHVSNPLVSDFHGLVEQQRSKYTSAPEAIKKDLAFLRQLLWLHAVVQLEWTDRESANTADNPTSAWIVDFNSSVDGAVNMTLSITTDTDPP